MKSGLDLSHINQNVRPQDDLYSYMNGSWIDSAVIPSDRPIHGAFHVLRDLSEENVRKIIEEAANAKGDQAQAQQIGDLYKSFMNEELIEVDDDDNDVIEGEEYAEGGEFDDDGGNYEDN